MSRRRKRIPPRRPIPPRRTLPAVTSVEPEPPYPRSVTVEELTAGKDDDALTAELAEALRKIPACQHCGGRHVRACPRIKRMSFHPNGTLAAVEFWPAGKWDEASVIWPEDLDAAG